MDDAGTSTIGAIRSRLLEAALMSDGCVFYQQDGLTCLLGLLIRVLDERQAIALDELLAEFVLKRAQSDYSPVAGSLLASVAADLASLAGQEAGDLLKAIDRWPDARDIFECESDGKMSELEELRAKVQAMDILVLKRDDALRQGLVDSLAVLLEHLLARGLFDREDFVRSIDEWVKLRGDEDATGRLLYSLRDSVARAPRDH
ncbi:hypothetical protein ABEG18_05330 [Alsobacter sp. KACC 23698]|uniref:Uncharacterized protein n=1 Tax=Alsobacter sp. KACC 23698 TaxID=3149229 RepID=A0AAU7JJ90_9HYPH